MNMNMNMQESLSQLKSNAAAFISTLKAPVQVEVMQFTPGFRARWREALMTVGTASEIPTTSFTDDVKSVKFDGQRLNDIDHIVGRDEMRIHAGDKEYLVNVNGVFEFGTKVWSVAP